MAARSQLLAAIIYYPNESNFLKYVNVKVKLHTFYLYLCSINARAVGGCILKL